MSAINPDLLPIHLEPTEVRFEAGGHVYHVEREARLSVARDRWLEKFGIYSILGRDGMSFLREVRKAYDANNNSKPGDVAVLLDNILKGAADLNAKEAPLYYLCTLFINREDEDRRSYDLEYAKQKIADWEGIERDFFFELGTKLSQNFQLSIKHAHGKLFSAGSATASDEPALSIRKRISQADAHWNKLLLALAEGRAEGVSALERMETIDFYYFYSAWSDRQQALADAYKT